MRKILLAFATCALLGCTKNNNSATQPTTLPNLTNTNWRGFITQQTPTTAYYEFIQFIGTTQATITVGLSLTDPNKSSGTYPCTIKTDPKILGSELFIITYPTKVDTGFTIQYTNTIAYHGYILTQQ